MDSIPLPRWAIPFVLGSVVGGFFVCQDWFGSFLHWIIKRIVIPAGIIGIFLLALGFFSPPSSSATTDRNTSMHATTSSTSQRPRTASLSSTSSNEGQFQPQHTKSQPKGPRRPHTSQNSSTLSLPTTIVSPLEYFSGDDLTMVDSPSPSPPFVPAARKTFSATVEKSSSDVAFRLPRRHNVAH